MQKTGAKNVFLDASHISEEKFAKRFPTIYGTCKEYNINPSKDFIPVSPSAHYFMGGIKTSVDGTTSIKGLYAIGEAACTGLHGANRLASNSILECAVTAYELVNYLKNVDLKHNFYQDESITRIIDFYNEHFPKIEIDTNLMFSQLKETMWEYAGIVRNAQKLNMAKEKIEKLKAELGFTYKCIDRNTYELRNMLTIAELIVDFAIDRKESRGAHYREDFPKTNVIPYSKEITKG